jgi:hypothetical protein
MFDALVIGSCRCQFWVYIGSGLDLCPYCGYEILRAGDILMGG